VLLVRFMPFMPDLKLINVTSRTLDISNLNEGTSQQKHSGMARVVEGEITEFYLSRIE